MDAPQVDVVMLRRVAVANGAGPDADDAVSETLLILWCEAEREIPEDRAADHAPATTDEHGGPLWRTFADVTGPTGGVWPVVGPRCDVLPLPPSSRAQQALTGVCAPTPATACPVVGVPCSAHPQPGDAERHPSAPAPPPPGGANLTNKTAPAPDFTRSGA